MSSKDYVIPICLGLKTTCITLFRLPLPKAGEFDVVVLEAGDAIDFPVDDSQSGEDQVKSYDHLKCIHVYARPTFEL